jgi:4-hydroxy-3-methylbut-2-en-1-yl diphosphate reductase
MSAGEALPGSLVVAAPMRLEQWLIRSGARALEVRQTGIGPRRSRASAAELRERIGEDGALLVMGFAGGLAPEGRPGEVVVAQELRGPGGERVECALAGEVMGRLTRAGIVARQGVVCSATRPVLGAGRRRLHEQGAIAVDMESLWLASELPGVRCAVVRVLSDVPAGGLPQPWRGAAGFGRACAALRRAAGALGS